MHFGTESLTGRDITLSFGIGKFIDPVFMDAFVKCIAEDDFPSKIPFLFPPYRVVCSAND